jgi:hypothetical protein
MLGNCGWGTVESLIKTFIFTNHRNRSTTRRDLLVGGALQMTEVRVFSTTMLHDASEVLAGG